MKPLAERVRPQHIHEYTGQQHLIAPGKVLYETIKNKQVPSLIFWGPPGVGKTTLARIIGQELGLNFYHLSAINAGVADVRRIIDEARKFGRVLLFLDEIHRFNKAQQDALLGAVENGSIVLIGATTENPSFEVNNALLSRCQVYVLENLSKDELLQIVEQAMQKDEWLQQQHMVVKEPEALLLYSGGDARKLLNLLELVLNSLPATASKIIDNKTVETVMQQRVALYDRKGEEHYNIVSAFIKSIRGSDPNAAVYYLARMLNGGENIEFIARRMVILASEDIGNANPTALVLATSGFQAIQMIGMPEARIILSQTAVYLATSPKSNASYMAIEAAVAAVQKGGELPVPLPLRNAPTKLMKELNYGTDYRYAHQYENNFTDLEYLPEALSGTKFYEPGENTREKEAREFLRRRWKEKYGY